MALRIAPSIRGNVLVTVVFAGFAYFCVSILFATSCSHTFLGIYILAACPLHVYPFLLKCKVSQASPLIVDDVERQNQ